MDHLLHARNRAYDAEHALSKGRDTLHCNALLDMAKLHATIAQADALTRVAEVGETLLEALSPDATKRIVELEAELRRLRDVEHDAVQTQAENDKLRGQVAAFSALWDSVNDRA